MPTMHGPGTRDENSKRRSIYFNIKRSQLIGSMVAFDLPEPLVSQGARPTTTVAPQALILMNSPQARTWAEGLAKRIQPRVMPKADQHGVPPLLQSRCQSRRTRRGFRFFEIWSHLADYCQVVLSLNEFIYVN
jgi:hypothetical protein